jgi:hypothetical protein
VHGAGGVEVPQRRFSPFSLIPSLDSLSASDSASLFPAGLVDSTNDHEPLDLRASNSWSLRSDEVEPRELAEVLSTNALAPFVLAQRLRPLMKKSPHAARYLILVSSMEGRLNRSKADMHVHTNMAKAGTPIHQRTRHGGLRSTGCRRAAGQGCSGRGWTLTPCVIVCVLAVFVVLCCLALPCFQPSTRSRARPRPSSPPSGSISTASTPAGTRKSEP